MSQILILINIHPAAKNLSAARIVITLTQYIVGEHRNMKIHKSNYYKH